MKLSDKTTTTKLNDILNEEDRFYKELYTSTGARPTQPYPNYLPIKGNPVRAFLRL